MSLVTVHPKRIRWMKNPWDVVSGFKHDNRLKRHRGIVSQWTFQVGLNITVDGRNVGGHNVKALVSTWAGWSRFDIPVDRYGEYIPC
jgi:hypothetical protein